jgi:hypothetical protein
MFSAEMLDVKTKQTRCCTLLSQASPTSLCTKKPEFCLEVAQKNQQQNPEL